MAGTRTWTDEMIAEMRDRLARGESLAGVAHAFGRCKTTIREIAIRYDINRPPQSRWSREEIDYLRAARDAGMSLGEIAEQLGRTSKAVSRKSSELHIEALGRKTTQWTDEKVAQLRELAELGIEKSAAAAAMGVSYDSIKSAAQLHGIEFKRSRAPKFGHEPPPPRARMEFPDWVRFEDDPIADEYDRRGRVSRPSTHVPAMSSAAFEG